MKTKTKGKNQKQHCNWKMLPGIKNKRNVVASP
jgi:hypothetical protein